MGMRSKGLKQSEPGERKTKRDAVSEISQLSVDDKHVITVQKKQCSDNQNALTDTRGSRLQQSKHTYTPTSTFRRTDTQDYIQQLDLKSVWLCVQVPRDKKKKVILTCPLLCNHPKSFCLVLSLEGIQVQDAANIKYTINPTLFSSNHTAVSLQTIRGAVLQSLSCKATTDLQVCIRAWMLRKNPTSFLSFR